MFMSTLLQFGRDVQGYNAIAPQFPTDIFTATLAASTAETVTVPANYPVWIMYVRVQPNGWCWCSRTTTAAIPASGSLASAASELIVGTLEFRRTVYAKDVISFLTPNTTCDIEVAFQAVVNP
jgi:hypothetical protein